MSYLDDRRNHVSCWTICGGIWLFVITFAAVAAVARFIGIGLEVARSRH